MGEKETYNMARRKAEAYAEHKMLDDSAIAELTEVLVSMSKWTLKRIKDIIPFQEKTIKNNTENGLHQECESGENPRQDC